VNWSSVQSLSFFPVDPTDDRLDEIEESHCPLSEGEISLGWHYCPKFGDMLVSPYHMVEWNECQCEVKRNVLNKKKIRVWWTCSDYVLHEHRFYFIAVLCGKIQKLADRLLSLYPR
jgi:hypothetical protein